MSLDPAELDVEVSVQRQVPSDFEAFVQRQVPLTEEEEFYEEFHALFLGGACMHDVDLTSRVGSLVSPFEPKPTEPKQPLFLFSRGLLNGLSPDMKPERNGHAFCVRSNNSIVYLGDAPGEADHHLRLAYRTCYD